MFREIHPTVSHFYVLRNLLVLFIASACMLTLGVFGCSTENPPIFLEYCIPVDASSSVPHVGVVLDYESVQDAPDSSSEVVRDFAVATESPLTVIPGDAAYTSHSLVVVDRYSSSKVAARLVFPEISLLSDPHLQSLLPFAGSGPDGILGGDVLRRFAVRFHYAADPQCTFDWTPGTYWPSVTFLREVPDSDHALGLDGFAVVHFTLAGGGNMVLSNREYALGATRVGIWLCINPDHFDPASPPEPVNGHFPVSGVDAYGLVATGSQSLVTTSGLAELITSDASVTREDVEITAMNETLQGYRLHGLTRVAIVGNVSEDLSPCAELAKRRGREYERHNPGVHRYPADLEGPVAPAVIVEVGDASPAGELDTVAVPDNSVFWTSLWAETSPQVPMYDVLVGGAVLRYLEFVIDYPQRRFIARCTDYTPEDHGVCPEDAPCCLQGGACNFTYPCMQLP